MDQCSPFAEITSVIQGLMSQSVLIAFENRATLRMFGIIVQSGMRVEMLESEAEHPISPIWSLATWLSSQESKQRPEENFRRRHKWIRQPS